MKTVCVYHSKDLDGWMSAGIVKHWWELNTKMQEGGIRSDTIDFIGYNYGQPIPDLSEYDKVIMCDISFPKEVMSNLMLFHKNNFIWIDHHVSAIRDNNDVDLKSNGIRDTNYAACELTWKYFMSNPVDKFGEVEDQNPMPEIVRLLGRYDCFGHKGTPEELKVLEFQYGARQCISNYEEAYTELLYSLQNYPIKSEIPIHENGKAIYRYLCTDAKQSYKNGFEIRLFTYTEEDHMNPHKFICINKERFNPINFGIDYHQDGYDGAACFHRTKDGRWAFSLYNDNGKVDCSQIAKQFGGGGHKGAAGFIIDDINKIIKNGSI